MRVVVAALVTLIVLVGTAANYGQTAAVFPYDTVTLTLPKGEAPAGRQAFVDLKCYLCHRVEGERGFPAPVSAAQGPDLDATLRRRPASEIAAAIIVPSHSVSVRTNPAVQKTLETRSLSPMGDFSRALSVRQLADLLAYLGSIHARLP